MSERQLRAGTLAAIQKQGTDDRYIKVGFAPNDENPTEVWFQVPKMNNPLGAGYQDCRLFISSFKNLENPNLASRILDIRRLGIAARMYRYPQCHPNALDLFSPAEIKKLISLANDEIHRNFANQPQMKIPFGPGKIQIFVKTFPGETITLRVQPDDTIKVLRQNIREKGYRPHRLVYNGRTLERGTLDDNDVCELSTIFSV